MTVKNENQTKLSCAEKRGGWNGGGWITKQKRLAIYLRDSFECAYCGSDLREYEPKNVTLDHIKPRCQGGGNSETNLITACKSCNSGRQDKAVKLYATPGAVERIQRNRRKSLKKFSAMAKALISGKTGDAVENER